MIRDAVTAVFKVNHKVYRIIRQPYLKAFPGYQSFPGGKVDRDESQTPSSLPFLSQHPAKLMNALVREIREELNYDLEAAVRDGSVTGLREICIATTPAFQAIRFKTHFFVIDLNHEAPFIADQQEAAEAGWIELKALVDLYHAGRFLAVPPVVRMIQALAQNPDLQRIDDIDLTYDPNTRVPCMQALPQFWQFPVRSHTLPPADRTNAFIIGGWLIDPAPYSDDEMERLLNTIAPFDLTGILITHHHQDHNERAEIIAARLNLPLHMSWDTHQRLTAKAPARFADLTVQFREDGQVLTQWLGRDVRLHAVPGHDEGQLALAPESMEWFLVGDLIQGIGTVVIHPPEGDMAKYFASLQKVIDLDPPIIIPSHGIAMGSTFRLKATLKHRQQREARILELHRQGKSVEEMLHDIYSDIDPKLHPLAMMNIRTHMAKLEQEGVL